MIVSDLGDGRVRFGNRPEAFDNRGVARACSSEGFRNADCPETPPRKFIELGLGENALSIPLSGSRCKVLGQYACYRKSFLIRRYAVGIETITRFDVSVVVRQGFGDG